MKVEQTDTIKWTQVNNVVPIVFSLITTVLTVAGLYYGLSNKIDRIVQDTGYIKGNIEIIRTLADDNNERIDNHEVRITVLERNDLSQSKQTSSLASAADISKPETADDSAQPAVSVTVIDSDLEPTANPDPSPSPSPTPKPAPSPSPLKEVLENTLGEVTDILRIE